MSRLLQFSLLGVVACCAWHPVLAQTQSVSGQSGAPVRVVPAENVRIEYAQVLKVEPVYQTLRATRVEEQCASTPVIRVPAPEPEREQPGMFSRMVDSVRGLFSEEEQKSSAPTPVPASPAIRNGNCQLVQVERQFQRPIAYDVDYVYKGTKYRSRLAEDPGNRLRIRVAVTPMVAEAPATSP